MFEVREEAAAGAAVPRRRTDGDLLAALAGEPGPELAAAALAAVDPQTLFGLGEPGGLGLVGAGHRLAAWGEWVKVQGLVAVFRSRRRLDSGDLAELDGIEDVQQLAAAAAVLQAERDDLAGRSTVAEASALFGISEFSLGRRLDAGLELRRLPGTGAALRAGVIDWSKAQSVTDAVRGLSDAQAAAVEARCLPAAARQTTRGLQHALAAAVLELAPQEAERRYREAKTTRGVSFRLGRELTPDTADGVPDGMGEMTTRTGAEELLTMRRKLDVLAKTARTDGDTRSLSQLRHDVLLDLITGAVHDPDDPDDPVDPAPDAEPDEPWPGETEPAEGDEPVEATHVAPEPDQDPQPDPQPGPQPGPRPGPQPDPEPGPEPGGRWARIDDSVLPTPKTPASSNQSDRSDRSGRSGRSDRSGRSGRSGRSESRDPEIVVLVGLDTLLGRDQAPGHLNGYGPIPASVARDLATRGVWRCAATDEHGTILGLGRATFTPNYRPPGATARFVKLRDHTCVFPGCRRQARHCDLDHQVPYRLGGATCACNLWSLCGHHHRLKHEAGFRVRVSDDPHDPPGTLTWTTPTRRQVPRYPTPAGRPRLPDEPPF